ncbi:MAG: HsdR family type I site-specific deoxyribonuclease [Patescibacteria group bacterium]|nr:HsdR family type I site-specific deoxyribonuclease [Patescibacteria group bacterium]MDE2015342.1 HsdR family type I site-specific deoxyribonuclease [Patescibacteria group bacterium]MDE2227147.1 HsdR family type I site-specific deoxyribonuclease [Patescibacteria group bacterium]
MKFNEQHTIENHIIKFLKEELGYEYIKPQEFAKLREFENEYVIVSLLTAAVKKINGITDETEAQAVVREIKKLDSNEAFLNVLRNGVNLKDPETGKMRDYFVVDYGKPEDNHFVVTNQFYFEGNSENIRPDVMVFLNGLPVVDIEAKSPTVSSSIDYSNAVGQIKRYERNAFKLFWSNCFNIASDGLKTVYGATYAPAEYFLQWREEELEKKYGEELEVTLAALLSHDRLLDIIGNFILFEKEQEGAVKKITRYMQYRATNKIIERVQKGETKRGLIWHTQGSGKSFTMFFTAWKLRFDKKLKNPKVFVLVDRIDLDDQLYNTFLNCGGQNVVRVESRRDLERKIQSPERGIFISTIQKFSELGDEVKNLDENIIVLSDEAHRDNEGISAINLRSAMTNAFFFGFTGTPIDRVTLNTHRNFGEEGERYLDYYSIQQAIDDGATLPVTYEARLSKFFIDEEELDKQFDELTVGLNEKEKDRISKKYGKKEAIIKLDRRMEAIARDIEEHFKLYVEPAGFKAQIVCYDREATAKYKKLLDQLVPKNWSEVIYSPGDANTDPEELRTYNTTKAKREKLINEFKDPNSPLKFLLVCDMLLTGFDAPVEQVMYLDKPLWDHNLLQAIARTNRIYPNKGAGKIIDYYGITRSLYKALNFDESIVDSAMINIDKLKEEFGEVLGELKNLFVGINIEDPSIENLRRCLKIFADNIEKQKFFQEKYARLKLLFEVLAPDPFLKKHIRAFEWFTSVFIAFEKEYGMKESDAELLAKYGEKVKQLIQQRVDYEGITKNFRELNVNDLYVMERLNKMDDDEKALNLEKMLKQEISINVDTNPAYKKFSERLLAIRKEFEQHQIDLAERIKRYQELLSDIKKKGDEAKELGFTLKEYGLFVISEEFIVDSDKAAVHEFIKEMTGRLEEMLDEGWQESSKREEFLKEAKRIIQELVLKEYKGKIKVNDFHKYLNRLIDIVIKKF